MGGTRTGGRKKERWRRGKEEVEKGVKGVEEVLEEEGM